MYNEVGSVSLQTYTTLYALARAADVAPGPGGSRITPVGYVTADHWAGEASVVALYPSAQLVAHRDPPIRGLRYHIPLDANTDCWVFHAGTWQQLTVGQIYQMDPTQPHGAVNWGSTLRLHFIIDQEP